MKSKKINQIVTIFLMVTINGCVFDTEAQYYSESKYWKYRSRHPLPAEAPPKVQFQYAVETRDREGIIRWADPAYVNARTPNGEIPLLKALQMHRLDVVKMLERNGAQWNFQQADIDEAFSTDRGKSLVEIYAENNDMVMANYCLKRGAGTKKDLERGLTWFNGREERGRAAQKRYDESPWKKLDEYALQMVRCPRCRGTGQLVNRSCPTCLGSGKCTRGDVVLMGAGIQAP